MLKKAIAKKSGKNSSRPGVKEKWFMLLLKKMKTWKSNNNMKERSIKNERTLIAHSISVCYKKNDEEPQIITGKKIWNKI